MRFLTLLIFSNSLLSQEKKIENTPNAAQTPVHKSSDFKWMEPPPLQTKLSQIKLPKIPDFPISASISTEDDIPIRSVTYNLSF